MKRASDVSLDERYLKEVFVASVTNQIAQVALSNAMRLLDEHRAEFRTFMSQVEAGKIGVTENMKGGWQSYVKKADYWMFAGYSGELGSISQFEAHSNRDPFALIYGFRFNKSGYITWADTIKDGFVFDEHGRIKMYYYNVISGQQEERVSIGDDGKVHYESWRKP